jgi:vitamin B12 transporter
MFSHSRVSAGRRGLALLSFVVFHCGRASAGDGEPPAAIALAPMIVTATRLPQLASEVASSVTVITQEEIERKQARTLPDILQDVPGLNLVQTGGPGGTTSVFMRGTNSNHVKVLLDGIDVGDPSLGNAFNFEHLLLADIERVEVLRGPQSGLYGADAIGGVINIITKKGSGPAQVTGSIEGGSFGTFNQTAGISDSVGRFNFGLDIAQFHSDDTPVTPNNLVPAGRTVQGDSYDNKTLSTRFGAALTDTFDVGLVARYIDTKLVFTNDDTLGPESLKSAEDKQQLYTRATAHLVLFDGRLDQTFGIGYAGFNTRDVDPNTPPVMPTLSRGDRVKLDWQGNVTLLPGQILTLGAEHQLDQINSTGPVIADMTNDAGYLQLQSSFGQRLFDTVSLRYDDNDRFGGAATFRVAPSFLIPETGTKLKSSVGTGFNPPTLTELFQSFPEFAFFANPALKPERSIGYDLGFEQAVPAHRVEFGGTYFHNDITDLIEINDAGTTNINIGKATTYGIESFVSYKPLPVLTLRGDYTFTIAEDDDLHQELLRRPKHKASLGAQWQATEAASLSVTTLYVGPWLDVNRAGTVSGIVADGYALVNVAGAYVLGQGVTAFARIDNLLDRHYQDPLGFLHPGLGVFAGVRVAFAATGIER